MKTLQVPEFSTYEEEAAFGIILTPPILWKMMENGFVLMPIKQFALPFFQILLQNL